MEENPKNRSKVTNIRVRKVFEEYTGQMKAGKTPNLYAIQRKYGYTHSSAKGYSVARTREWNRLLDKVDDKKILNRLEEIVFKGKDRDSLAAIQELNKLKNRYPKRDEMPFDADITDLIEYEEPAQIEEAEVMPNIELEEAHINANK